jgi:polysaccharide deacetylase 2 family uncharacterized protein YibQ
MAPLVQNSRWRKKYATPGDEHSDGNSSALSVVRSITWPCAVGINKLATGSKMTSNPFGMQKVMQVIERYNLYFPDTA